jgi:hypothetical protein
MNSSDTRVIFLHLPKTAGQSVHKTLIDLFGPASACPARVNEQLLLLSIEQIRQYRVLSGHFDWSLVDCAPEPKFVFTVLREPADRVLSFYFYLREDAAKLSKEELNLPWNAGRKAALEWSCDDYFCSAKPDFRNFIANYYDNVYLYYFAGRGFEARPKLLAQQARHSLSDNDLIDLAWSNLSTLDGVYSVDHLEELDRDLAHIAGAECRPKTPFAKVNVGSSEPHKRLQALAELGATQKSFDRIEQMVRLDRVIWTRVQERVGRQSANATRSGVSDLDYFPSLKASS